MKIDKIKEKLRKIFQFIVEWLKYDSWRKFFALLIGIISWSFVHKHLGQAAWETVPGVRVDIKSASEFVVSEEDSVQSINIKLKISGSRKDKPLSNEFSVEIDLNKENLDKKIIETFPYEYTITLSEKHVTRKPQGVSIKSFEPEEIVISLDKYIEKDVKVDVTVQGALKPGLHYTTSAIPEKISISGLFSELKNIETVNTDPLLLSLKNTHDFTTNLDVFNPDSRYFKIRPGNVEVKVTIEDTNTFGSQRFPDIPLRVLSNYNTSLFWQTDLLPKNIEVYLRGPKVSLAAVKKEELEAILDLTKRNLAGSDEIDIQIRGYPRDLEIEWQIPHKITLNLYHVNSALESKNTIEVVEPDDQMKTEIQ